jgi:hypothetical protein
MNAQTITDALNQKSDSELKGRIDAALRPLFEEAKEQDRSQSKKDNPKEWEQFKDNDWVGTHYVKYGAILFLYLREKQRAISIARFIAKVESVEQMRDELQDIANNHQH